MVRAAVTTFLAALAYFTRIPCPRSVTADESARQQAASFAPLAGWVVGAVAAAAYAATASVLPVSIAVLAAIIAAVWITGGLHEDGLADFWDGFGLGRTREQTLAIMADSRSGAFAVLGVVLVLLAKWVVLVEVASLATVRAAHGGAIVGGEEPGAWLLVGAVLFAGHALSRLASVGYMYTHAYARPEPRARGRHLATAMSARALVFAGVCGLGPLAVFPAMGHAWVALAVVPVLGVWVCLGLWFTHRLGGYTGDCLGAAQQLTELAFYLSVCALLFPAGAGS